tara:strand:+ start:518 stop:706 length:189 start_codon:yes stop_codon:yes gene_type:complete
MWKVALLILDNGAPPPASVRDDHNKFREQHEQWLGKTHASQIIPLPPKKNSTRKKKRDSYLA